MNKAISVTKLDFLTVNAFITPKVIIIFLAFIIPVSMLGSGGGLTMIVMSLIFLSVAIMSYPFAIGEKNNIDSLLSILGTDRETVVFGRYMFTIAINIILVLGAILINLFGSAVFALLGKNYDLSIIPLLIFTMASFVTIVEAITLPIYFHRTYAKAKISIGIIFCLSGFFLGFIISGFHDGSYERIYSSLNSLYPSDLIAGLINIAFLGISMIISYMISVKNYKKREF